MGMGAPPMTPQRYQQLAVLWSMAENSSNGSISGLAWSVSVERSSSGAVIQLVAKGSGCTMIVREGQWHPEVAGAVDAFFSYNGELLDQIAEKEAGS